MRTQPNAPKILAAFEKQPWVKVDFCKDIDGRERFNPIGMLLREMGIPSTEIQKLDIGTAWLRFGRELQKEYGLDVVDFHLVLIAGDSSVSADDMINRVGSVLRGDINAIAPFYRPWVDSVVANRDAIYDESEKALIRFQSHRPPEFVARLGENEADPAIRVARIVWQQKEAFVRWPARRFTFWPGLTRLTGTGRKTCYTYSQEQLDLIKKAGLIPRAWNNDPAIFAFRIAGGERPRRADGKWEWNVHHIYDGRFPVEPGRSTLHAVKHRDYFTDAAGLVAVHPVADALASEVPYFAWLLRFEAFCRFDGFDPDGVFVTCK